MISYLALENFKLFREKTEFNFSNLNLLTGINGRGKSTLLQAILILQQSIKGSNGNHLLLNGDNVELGEYEDIKNKDESMGTPIRISFCLETEKNQSETNSQIEFDFLLKYIDTQKSVLGVDYFKMSSNLNLHFMVYESTFIEFISAIYNNPNKGGTLKIGDKTINKGGNVFQLMKDVYGVSRDKNSKAGSFRHNLLRELESLHYISADRIGPKKFYEKNSLSSFVSTDKKGNNIADILSFVKNENKLVKDSLHIKESVYEGVAIQDISATILAQVGNWIGVVTDTNNVAIELDDTTSPHISTLKFIIDGVDYSPMNIGFGYSYILPIIISGLIANTGEILIVENPEAHLHPRAQSRLARFLSKVANNGVQVFIESHSEHILNAIRVSVKNEEIAAADTKVFYFMDDEIVEPVIDSDGRIEDWRDGFFDEWDINLMELM